MESLQVQGNFIWEETVVTIMEWLVPVSIGNLRRGGKENKMMNERQRAKKDKATNRTYTINA